MTSPSPQGYPVTGQVARVSEYPVALGTFNDIYIGEPTAAQSLFHYAEPR